jgi:sulfite reductase (NADPH) flavoprotein alpha-component
VARDLWSWIGEGAHIYVCGDALRMAKDVESVLTEIIAQQGDRTTDEAAKFIAELKAQGHYQADVY